MIIIIGIVLLVFNKNGSESNTSEKGNYEYKEEAKDEDNTVKDNKIDDDLIDDNEVVDADKKPTEKSNNNSKEKELEIKIEKNGVVAETKYNEKQYGYDLYINGKKTVFLEYVNKENIQILDDIVVASGSSTDIRTTTIYIFDKNAKQLKAIYKNFDEPALMITESKGSDYKIVNNDITFNADAFSHMNEVYLNSGDLISKDDYCNSTKYDNNIVSGKFKITYEGNGKLSDIKRESTSTLLDEKSWLCAQDNE